MSLSPKDDPRTWLAPGPRTVPRPPLKARLLYYALTKSERALLGGMFEHAPEGAVIELSPRDVSRVHDARLLEEVALRQWRQLPRPFDSAVTDDWLHCIGSTIKRPIE